jgi:hypothetical protein
MAQVSSLTSDLTGLSLSWTTTSISSRMTEESISRCAGARVFQSLTLMKAAWEVAMEVAVPEEEVTEATMEAAEEAMAVVEAEEEVMETEVTEEMAATPVAPKEAMEEAAAEETTTEVVVASQEATLLGTRMAAITASSQSSKSSQVAAPLTKALPMEVALLTLKMPIAKTTSLSHAIMTSVRSQPLLKDQLFTSPMLASVPLNKTSWTSSRTMATIQSEQSSFMTLKVSQEALASSKWHLSLKLKTPFRD